MFNLMSVGLASQRLSLGRKSDYHRIVGLQEKLHDVFLEAIEHQCFVYSNGRQTVIADKPPKGFARLDSRILNNLPPEAA